MTTKELKQLYLSFFESNGHAIIPGASLIPENDPTVLFTMAGMHPLVPYLLGEKHPAGQRLVNVQKCIRTGDIDEVGDNWHLTFFEMLGNWSLGDYFKQEAIKMSFEFLTKELNIPLEKLAVTCFEGDEDSPKDDESANIWKSLGVSEKRIAYLPKEDNWWPAGGKMPGPQGPDTEMFYWTGEDKAPEVYDPKDKKWVEIWNDVFMQYNKTLEGEYKELNQKNVDTGMGLERTVAVLNGKASVYETEKLYNIILQITSLINLTPDDLSEEQTKYVRRIADHLRAATFILAEKVEPSNVEQGYVLRRLIRRAVRYGKQLGINNLFTHQVAEIVISEHGGFYKELRDQRDFIISQLTKEEEKFQQPLSRVYQYRFDLEAAVNNGIVKKIKNVPILSSEGTVSGKYIYENYQSYGVPPDLCLDVVKELGLKIDQEEYDESFKQHQETSRIGAEQKFKGGLADSSETSARMHTATHLMLAALRKVLGDHVFQKGSNITSERIRFDFSHTDKMTPEQIKQVEDLVNEQIQKNIPVVCEEMSLDKAKEKGAMGVFEHKYGDKVKVYSIGEFSKEICGGPHAKNTGELGHFKIQKEESSSAGVRRIKAVLE
ncbi:MAG: alanine--tRNA ligase [Candidatus Buchananbacteria bacterium]